MKLAMQRLFPDATIETVPNGHVCSVDGVTYLSTALSTMATDMDSVIVVRDSIEDAATIVRHLAHLRDLLRTEYPSLPWRLGFECVTAAQGAVSVYVKHRCAEAGLRIGPDDEFTIAESAGVPDPLLHADNVLRKAERYLAEAGVILHRATIGPAVH